MVQKHKISSKHMVQKHNISSKHMVQSTKLVLNTWYKAQN